MVITKTTLLLYSLNFRNHQKLANTASILFDMLLFTFTVTCVRLLTAQKFKPSQENILIHKTVFHDLGPFASLKIVTADGRQVIFSKV